MSDFIFKTKAHAMYLYRSEWLSVRMVIAGKHASARIKYRPGSWGMY